MDSLMMSVENSPPQGPNGRALLYEVIIKSNGLLLGL